MRLDKYLYIKKYYSSSTKAQQAIERGEIYVDGKQITKSSFFVCENENHEIIVNAQENYVSIGGYKLSKALKDFGFSPDNLVCLDVGASTGGFTDCLLKNGATKVYAVDLNDQLLHETLKEDKRVVPIIKNAKELTIADFKDPINFICADLSFISATNVLELFAQISNENTTIILLIKPQFELNKKIKLKNGIIRDEKLRVDALKRIYDFSVGIGLYPCKITTAPISSKKNIEYLIMLTKDKLNLKSYEELYKNLNYL